MLINNFYMCSFVGKIIASSEGVNLYETGIFNATVWAAIIAAVASIVGLIVNVCLSLHRNKLEGIVAYRMKWINDLREEFSEMLSWECCKISEKGEVSISSIDSLRKSIYKIDLMLNICDKFDKEISEKLLKYLKSINSVFGSKYFAEMTEEPTEKTFLALNMCNEFQISQKLRKELQKLAHIYLKVEWMRVRAESSLKIIRNPYKEYWSFFKGFQADKAFEYYKEQYEEYDI